MRWVVSGATLSTSRPFLGDLQRLAMAHSRSPSEKSPLAAFDHEYSVPLCRSFIVTALHAEQTPLWLREDGQCCCGRSILSIDWNASTTPIDLQAIIARCLIRWLVGWRRKPHPKLLRRRLIWWFKAHPRRQQEQPAASGFLTA